MSRRNTGPTQVTKDMLAMRAGGRCELCDRPLHAGAPFSRHHRRPRGMGGSRADWINNISNLLLVCGTATTGCHQRIEHNRAVSYDAGWLLRPAAFPWETPVQLSRGLVLLTADGMVNEVAA